MLRPDHLSHLERAVTAVGDELVDLRRDLHAHPELAWEEERTTSLVAKRLDEAGVRVQLLPRSGLIADLGPEEGPVVALRADLDALPVDDRSGEPWARTCCAGVSSRIATAATWSGYRRAARA